MPSFDIVSEIDEVALRHAVDNANRELSTRFDFRGVEASIENNDDWHILGWSDPTAEWMYRGVLMWSAVDPEGEAVSVGVDHDRDGVVDVQLPRAEGRIANETTGMLAIPWNGSIVVERVAQYGEGCHLSFTRFFDVIATDASGNAATYTCLLYTSDAADE